MRQGIGGDPVRDRSWILTLALCAALPLRADAASIYLSTTTAATLGGLGFRNGDIARYDTTTGTATLFFSEDTFDTNEDVDAFDLLPNGHLLLSTTSTSSIGGVSFLDGDLIDYDPATGSAVLYFSESLFSDPAADVDGVDVLPNGHILLSARTGTETLGGLTFRDGDIAEYDPVSGFATLYFSEDHFVTGEDLDAFSVLPDGSIILSTTNAASISGVAIDEDDLVQYFPSTDTASLYFSGSLFGSAEDIDAVLVTPEPGSAALLLLGLAGLAAHRRTAGRRAATAQSAADGN
jgi:hypothetical protein